jgi:hypothetical protein
MTDGNTIVECPGRDTCGGWSLIENPIGCPDQFKYSMVRGGANTAMFTCREINFCDLFDDLPFWIINIAPFEGVKSSLAFGGPATCS